MGITVWPWLPRVEVERGAPRRWTRPCTGRYGMMLWGWLQICLTWIGSWWCWICAVCNVEWFLVLRNPLVDTSKQFTLQLSKCLSRWSMQSHWSWETPGREPTTMRNQNSEKTCQMDFDVSQTIKLSFEAKYWYWLLRLSGHFVDLITISRCKHFF